MQNGDTPLHLAATDRPTENVKLLLEAMGDERKTYVQMTNNVGDASLRGPFCSA